MGDWDERGLPPVAEQRLARAAQSGVRVHGCCRSPARPRSPWIRTLAETLTTLAARDAAARAALARLLGA